MDKQKKIEMPTGWLSPDGDLWECSTYEHSAMAEEICEKLKIESNTWAWKGEDEALYSLGWCKLGLMSLGDREYWVHWERPLTAYQRYFLKEYFENEKDLKFPMDSTSLCKYLYEDRFFDENGERK